MADVVMPRLSDSMEEGTVLRWLKSVGDEVAVGDELVEIETDKANMVYEADSAGTLVEIVAAEGDTLGIGEVIARVGDAESVGDAGNSNGGAAPGAASESRDQNTLGETATPSASESAPESASQGSGAAASGASGPAAGVASEDPTASLPGVAGVKAGGDGGRVKASPLARRIARDRGVELRGLAGSGPGGRIVKADVERAMASAAPASAAPAAGASERPETAKGQVQVVELSRLQQTVSRRMAESKATAPHFYLQAEIDMTAAVAARRSLKEIAAQGAAAPGREAEEAAPGGVPTFNDMVVKACALALREFPRANGAYRDGKIELYSRVNVGVAVAAQDALVVPTVFDADLKGLRRISEETRALASRVRDGSITPPELSGGTFTVSNLGMYGVSNFHAVINTPQAGILAVGELKQKPAVIDGRVEPRDMMGVTLACDHRILYGADGAAFLRRIRELLEEPIGLAL